MGDIVKAVRTRYNMVRFDLVLGVMCALAAAAVAAPAPSQSEAPPKWHADKITATRLGIRLEGHASIATPEMSVTATTIELDTKGGNAISEVRAHQGVSLTMNTTPRGGGAAVGIDVHSDEATADLVKSTLLLVGHVDGQYTIGKGQPNTLHGSRATLTLVNQNLNVDVEGGAEGVRLEIPPEPVKKAPGPNGAPPDTAPNPAAVGTVIITAQRATLQAVLKQGNTPTTAPSTGTAHFTGNARAVSTDGPTKFDIAAAELVLTRAPAGTIDTLRTVGRTQLKIDFPPEQPKGPVTVAVPPAPGAEPKPGDKTPNKVAMGRPTHVEAEADSATVQRPSNTVVLEGNVTGFYRLAPTAAENAEPADTAVYHFAADRANLSYVTEGTADNAEGLHVEVIGRPGVFETPNFLKFGG